MTLARSALRSEFDAWFADVGDLCSIHILIGIKTNSQSLPDHIYIIIVSALTLIYRRSVRSRKKNKPYLHQINIMCPSREAKHKTVSHIHCRVYIRSGRARKKFIEILYYYSFFFISFRWKCVFILLSIFWHVNNDVECACNLYVLQVTTTTFFFASHYLRTNGIFFCCCGSCEYFLSHLVNSFFKLIVLRWSLSIDFFMSLEKPNHIMRRKIKIKIKT